MNATPGPWRVVGGKKRFVIIAGEKQIASCEIDEAYLLSCRHLFETREQQEANARLIAAAPDLLAACEDVLAAAHRTASEEKFGEAITAILDRIASAVTKATN